MSTTGGIDHPPGTVARAGIITPDAVGLDLQIATLGSRGAAYLVDLSMLGSVFALLVIGQAVLGVSGFVPGWLGIAVLLLFAFLWQFGYPIGFEVLNHGRTPGKAVLGLRVVTVEGAPVGLRHATIRASVGILELLGTTGAVAVLSSFASPRNQRLGDMAAGTLVVRERRGGGAPAAERFVAPAGLERYTAQLDVSGLRASDYATIRETLRRVRDLPAEVRADLTAEIARPLVDRVRPAPPADVPAEAFLRCLAAAVQARRAPAGGHAPAPSRAPGGEPGTALPTPGSRAPAAGGGTPLADRSGEEQTSPASIPPVLPTPPEHPGDGFVPPG